MTEDPSILMQSAMPGVCSETTNGWLYYCDVHDTHGNADSEAEARHMAAAHSEYFAEDDDEEECDVFVWSRAQMAVNTPGRPMSSD
ncbi:hypothetical protein [Pedococcus ginsenosidimutans]